MTRRQILLASTALILLGAALVAGVGVPGAALSVAQADTIIKRVVGRYFPAVHADEVLTIASIESDFNPTAVRLEPTISDASAGMMQTLVGTAQWLFDHQGYTAKGRPTFERLFDPEISVYFGAAYLDYLTRKQRADAEAVRVRMYNAGPGGVRSAAADRYLNRYIKRKTQLFGGG